MTMSTGYQPATLAEIAEDCPEALEYFDAQCADIARHDAQFMLDKRRSYVGRRLKLKVAGLDRAYWKPEGKVWVRLTMGVTSYPRDRQNDPRWVFNWETKKWRQVEVSK